jgi:hypothetical protein
MPLGSEVGKFDEVAAGGTLTVRPPDGVEWAISCLKSEQGKVMKVYHVDTDSGTTETLVDTQAGGAVPCFHRLCYARYIVLENAEADARKIGYEGVQSNNP